MGLSIFSIHDYLLRRMSRIINLEAINGNLPSEFIKQEGIIAGKSIASSRMGDKTDRPTALSCIADRSQVVGGPEDTRIRDHLASRWFSCSVAQFFYDRHQGVLLLRTPVGQESIQLVLIWP